MLVVTAHGFSVSKFILFFSPFLTSADQFLHNNIMYSVESCSWPGQDGNQLTLQETWINSAWDLAELCPGPTWSSLDPPIWPFIRRTFNGVVFCLVNSQWFDIMLPLSYLLISFILLILLGPTPFACSVSLQNTLVIWNVSESCERRTLALRHSILYIILLRH